MNSSVSIQSYACVCVSDMLKHNIPVLSIKTQIALVKDNIIALIKGWFSSSELGGQFVLDKVHYSYEITLGLGYVKFISHRVPKVVLENR